MYLGREILREGGKEGRRKRNSERKAKIPIFHKAYNIVPIWMNRHYCQKNNKFLKAVFLKINFQNEIFSFIKIN